MPAAEAVSVDELELANYELAFHVLPTVAEGEVTNVVDKIKDAITKAGGEVTNEEAPERFDLAYDIVKYLEGRNRKFSSAYFGWVRFTLAPAKLAEVTEIVESVNELLRHLTIRLTKTEEENVFNFHDSIERKVVENVEAEPIVEAKEVVKDESDGEDKEETV